MPYASIRLGIPALPARCAEAHLHAPPEQPLQHATRFASLKTTRAAAHPPVQVRTASRPRWLRSFRPEAHPEGRGRSTQRGTHGRVTMLALVLACLTGPAASQDLRTPSRTKAAVFEIALWPGEGRPRLVAGSTTLTPHAEPRADAPTGAPLRVEKGQVLEFGETLYRTTVAGRLMVLKDAVVTGRRLGSALRLSRDDYYSDRYPTASLPVRAGEVIDYLQPRAEGSCFVRLRGEIMEADPCPHLVVEPVERFALDMEPRTEWWVRLRINGRPGDWLLVDGKSVREGGRTFNAG